jgi:uncharacterized membrane protein
MIGRPHTVAAVTKFLLAVHVLAAIVAVGPVTVAASMFPPAARRALAAPDDEGAAGTLRLLHRICRVYALVGVVVPVFGFATASEMHVLGSAWLIASIVLTALAALVLAALVLPAQHALVGDDADAAALRENTGDSTPQNDATAPRENRGDSTAPPQNDPTPRRDGDGTARLAARLGMTTGLFNLLWATVTVLMIVRPGSSTGA